MFNRRFLAARLLPPPEELLLALLRVADDWFVEVSLMAILFV
jgi:hypothetical protein